MDALVDLLAMHGDVLGRGDAHAHLVALHPEHGDGDRIADHERLADASGEDQHLAAPIPVDTPLAVTWVGDEPHIFFTNVNDHNDRPTPAATCQKWVMRDP